MTQHDKKFNTFPTKPAVVVGGVGGIVTLLTVFIQHGGLQMIENYWNQHLAQPSPASPQNQAPAPATPAASPF